VVLLLEPKIYLFNNIFRVILYSFKEACQEASFIFLHVFKLLLNISRLYWKLIQVTFLIINKFKIDVNMGMAHWATTESWCHEIVS